jgi:hypothetical protein
MISNLPETLERYRPKVEQDEPETGRKLAETMLSITQKTYDETAMRRALVTPRFGFERVLRRTPVGTSSRGLRC